MTGTLKVEPSRLKSTANAFQATGRDIKSMTTNMTNIVNQLSGRVWSGEAAEAYKKRFNMLQDDINKMVRMIDEHVRDLNSMATEYERVENQNKELSSGLRGDVIS